MTRGRLAGAAAIAVGLLASHAGADNPPGAAIEVGRSIFIANDVDGQAGEAPPRRIAVNDDILFQEDITTGDAAKAVIEFRDGSTFELGPNAVVRIDSFVFNPEESTGHKALSVTRGVFRYVSGFVAGDQDTLVKTPGGSMAIRGSVAAGIVDPSVPDFLYLGEGSATFTNTAGSSALRPGNAIAVPSAAAAPMAPDAMPAPVAAQALQVIERRLPPRAALATRPAADEAWLKRAGAADLVPGAEQQRVAVPGTARPMPMARGAGSLAGELGLLVEANRVNLFARSQVARTPEQTAFLARVSRERPDAAATLRRFTDQARAIHAGNVTRGTEFVIRGVGHAAPTVQVMRRVTDAAARANPSAAATINRHATEAYRGADRGELNRPRQRASERPGAERPAAGRPANGRPANERPANERPANERPANERPANERPANERPGAQRPTGQQRVVHPPNDYERRQPGGQNGQPGRQQRQQQDVQQRRQGGNVRPPPQQQQRPQAGPPSRQQKPQRDRGDRRGDEPPPR